MDKKEFIASVKNAAIKSYIEHNIFASMTIAQAILESGWGASALTKKGNNLFGIKAGSSWKGKTVIMGTREYNKNNELYHIEAVFRAYNTLGESLEDHTKLLLAPRYKLVREAKSYGEACSRLKTCGYATDPVYPEKLITIIKGYKLYEYDKKIAVIENKAQWVVSYQKLINELGITDYEGKTLEEDGKAGPRTLSTISKLGVIKRGYKGRIVRFIQKMVGASEDGSFGPLTEKGVIAYQKEKGIAQDGRVGPETFITFLRRGK